MLRSAQFLNGALRKVNLALNVPGDVITNTRVSDKFAFIQLRSEHETSNALNLSGIPFMGAFLKVSRPGKYMVSECTFANGIIHTRPHHTCKN